MIAKDTTQNLGRNGEWLCWWVPIHLTKELRFFCEFYMFASIGALVSVNLLNWKEQVLITWTVPEIEVVNVVPFTVGELTDTWIILYIWPVATLVGYPAVEQRVALLSWVKEEAISANTASFILK